MARLSRCRPIRQETGVIKNAELKKLPSNNESEKMTVCLTNSTKWSLQHNRESAPRIGFEGERRREREGKRESKAN